ncbi:phosphatidylserine decarboxylase [Gracilaria domingensis]|nr:phosphatidylserine decarboxylase [Gracilaria domingensis]
MSNSGRGDTDFSIFEEFHRAYYMIKTENFWHVAMIPVGLNTIGRITPSLVGDESSYVPPGGTPVSVAKGQKVGHFAYGGSLNILMFEERVFPSVSVLMNDTVGQMTPKIREGKKGDNYVAKIVKENIAGHWGWRTELKFVLAPQRTKGMSALSGKDKFKHCINDLGPRTEPVSHVAGEQ